MVRTYKKKTNGPKWSAEDLAKAMDDCKSGMSLYKAAKSNGIPETTLRRHVNEVVQKKGKPTVLTAAEEMEIFLICDLFGKWGFGVTKAEVTSVIAEFFEYNKRPNPFKDNTPGPDWWSGFMKRHPQLVKRKPQPLQVVRAKSATVAMIDDWFESCLKPTLTELGLTEKPHCIYNVDETGFPLSGRPSHVLVKRGSKSVHTVIGGSGRDFITVQACISSTGQLLSPYVVYSGKRLIAEYTQNGPCGARYSVTDSGWMTTPTFVNWLKDLFIPALPEERPVLLILDGHMSHVSYEVRMLAIEHNITLLKLPSHLTHVLQPLDVSVFKPMKATWDRVVLDHTRRNRKQVGKKDFPHLLGKVWKEYIPEHGKNGFKKTGIIPYDKNAIARDTLKYSQPYTDPTSSSGSPDLPPHPLVIQDAATCNMSTSPTPPSVGSTPSVDPTCTSSSVGSTPSVDPTPSSLGPTLSSAGSTPSSSLGCTSSSVDLAQSIASQGSSLGSPDPMSAPSQLQLRHFFSGLLSQTTTTAKSNATSRRRLAGVGESLTSEEAMTRLQRELEEKQEKEKEKQRRKEQRLERKRKKEQTAKGKTKTKKRKQDKQDIPVHNQPNDTNTQTRCVCLECETFFDEDEGEDWIECGHCLNWYHIACVELDLTPEEIESFDFQCTHCS